MALDLSPKDIEILMRWCDWGTRVGEGHDYRGGEQLRKALLEDHPMSQWAYELGIRAAEDSAAIIENKEA
jgi:hypothetical protein